MTRRNRNIFQRHGIWWFSKTIHGRTISHSLGTRDVVIARQRRGETLADIQAGKWGDDRRHTFGDAVERWEREHLPTLRPASQRRYRVSLAHLSDAIGQMLLTDITSARLYEFEQARRAHGISSSTIRRDLACLSSLLSSAEEWEWLDRNPVAPYLRGRGKKGLTESPARTRHLSESEERALLRHATAKPAQAIAFAIDTGLRREEQFSLLKSDVDTELWTLTVRSEIAKSSRARTIPLPERARKLVRRILDENTRSPYLFTTNLGQRYSKTSPVMYDALQIACRRAGLAEHVMWHDLRRTCGCRLLNVMGLDMAGVSLWLGHSSIRVTERCYAFLMAEKLQEKLREHENRAPATQAQSLQNLLQSPPSPQELAIKAAS